ncbi:MAG: MCE family protein [Gammaproteobacteria bacterium]|nr:MCE family protein [Gammaproteobacteria bacterium]
MATDRVQEYFQEPLVIYGHLTAAHGVGKDTIVRISGINAGSVSDIRLTDDIRIMVTMQIRERFRRHLHADAKAELSGLSFIGVSSIDIHPGSPGKPLLKQGTVLPLQAAASINEVMARVEPILERVDKVTGDVSKIIAAVHPKRVDETVENIHQSSTNLRELSDHIRAGNGLVGAAVYSPDLRQDAEKSISALEKTLTTAYRTMETADKTLTLVQARVSELEPVFANAAEMSESTKAAARSLPGLVSGLEQTVTQINLTLSTINTDLQQFPDLVARLMLLVDKVSYTLDSLQRTWPFSSVMGPEGGKSMIEVQPLND